MTNEEQLETMYKQIEQTIKKLVKIQKNIDKMKVGAKTKNKK